MDQWRWTHQSANGESPAIGGVRPQDTVSPEAFARAERSQARNTLGAGLAQQLESTQASVHQAPHALQIVFAIVFTCGVLTGLLAWLQMSLVLGAASMGLMVLKGFLVLIHSVEIVITSGTKFSFANFHFKSLGCEKAT